MSNSSGPAEPKEPDVTPEEESWATTLEHGFEEIRTQSAGVLFLDVIKIDLPYIVMLSTAVLGIGIVTFTGQPVAFYWEFLTPVYCAICIYIGWRHTETTHERTRLVWTQILHWAAFLFGMWLIYSPPLRQLIDVNAAGLNLMVLLAVATFVAGVHAAAWQICVVGIILGIFVPAVAIIQRSSLFILVSVLGIVFVAASIYITLHSHRRKARAAEETV
ncbi:hypothetical protein IYW40_00785 [Methylocystis sp. H4A]|jgi:hypothetical protein|uniref:hypothetical protein n=1 Tax=Methylocystis sp. H4A TaxID=2785788 RepID=UPI0018C2DDA6|nr:hypothetical protein [Methylocystis sp. H4A]MBG0800058.1 hypothetical protein [Methylocystis sp. H4A]